MKRDKNRNSQAGSVVSQVEDRHFIQYLESQPLHAQESLAQANFDELLLNAAKPRQALGNACVKLCHYVELCMKSNAPPIKAAAFSVGNGSSLFNFYIEWNEKNQSRSMRQVLELIASLVAKNPDQSLAFSLKTYIVRRILSVLAHEESQPLIKPAFKSLEYLISKRTVSPQFLIQAYHQKRHDQVEDSLSLTSAFVMAVFDWIGISDVAPAAGKLLVTLFIQMRNEPIDSSPDIAATSAWQTWIRTGISKNPAVLESIKNYIFLPLFKLDRMGSLAFLEELNGENSVAGVDAHDLDYQSLLHLAAIEVGKKAGLVEEPNTVEFKQGPKRAVSVVVLKEDTIFRLLLNASETVRSLAFSVVVSSSSSIRPFSPFALKTMQENLSTLHSDGDAKFRNEVLSSSKHMIDRLRGSTAFLAREIDSIDARSSGERGDSRGQSGNDALKILLRSHTTFIEWYSKFLVQEMIPTTSYQRHITALKALDLLLRSGIIRQNSFSPQISKADNETVWSFQLDFFTPSSMRLLLDLLMDPFDDVRSGAAGILKFASPLDFTAQVPSTTKANGLESGVNSVIGNFAASSSADFSSSGSDTEPTILLEFIRRAEEKAKRTGRADYADGVARSHDLLYLLQTSPRKRIDILGMLVAELEYKVKIAEKDLGRAVSEAPVHGTFAGLSLVWGTINFARDFGDAMSREESESFSSIQQRIVGECRRIWMAVRDILCNDSPEGLILDEIEEGDNLDTKDVLSYSFRAIHESSNLMRTMVNKLDQTSSNISSEIFSDIGKLTFEQLSKIRHRGALSTVSLTFTRCCQLTQVRDQHAQELLLKWYQGALDCIFEQVSTTRRSAGIPSLLIGIMAASAKEPAFEEVINKLKSFAKQAAQQSEIDQTNLPQVHAMNSLRETFKSSTLGRLADRHIGECFQISAESLKSEIWAIRNCGLLLLRSLIDCLFGTSDSKSTIEAGWDGKSIKISYENHPALAELLVKLLGGEVTSDGATRGELTTVESVFPALDIIRRAGPPSTHREKIYELVKSHLGSKVWSVREMAAHALSVLVHFVDWPDVVKILLQSGNLPLNVQHGNFMAARFIIERQASIDSKSAKAGLCAILSDIHLAATSAHMARCPEVLTAFIEVQNSGATLLASSPGMTGANICDGSISSALLGSDPILEFLQINRKSPYSYWNTTLIALGRKCVGSMLLERDVSQLGKVLEQGSHLGTDVALAILKCVSETKLAQQLPLEMCEAYISTIIAVGSSEVRASALNVLFQSLNNKIHDQHSDLGPLWAALIELSDALETIPLESPGLANAKLRMSGWLLAAAFSSIQNADEQAEWKIDAWAGKMNLAGKKTEDFDTRLAAVLAIDAFYATVQTFCLFTTRLLLPCHLVLYNCLNDDDSEIREIAANTFSSYMSKSFMPLASQRAMADLLFDEFRMEPLLMWNIVSRMTGSLDLITTERCTLESPSHMFNVATSEDNTLFVEEDQNLYIDEVRETKYWIEILERIIFRDGRESVRAPEELQKEAISALVSWTSGSLEALKMIDQPEGVLGWASRPVAYSACFRTMACSTLLLKYDMNVQNEGTDLSGQTGIEKIFSGLKSFLTDAVVTEFHPSLLAEMFATFPEPMNLPAWNNAIYAKQCVKTDWTMKN